MQVPIFFFGILNFGTRAMSAINVLCLVSRVRFKLTSEHGKNHEWIVPSVLPLKSVCKWAKSSQAKTQFWPNCRVHANPGLILVLSSINPTNPLAFLPISIHPKKGRYRSDTVPLKNPVLQKAGTRLSFLGKKGVLTNTSGREISHTIDIVNWHQH